jgi:hypothetical protein
VVEHNGSDISMMRNCPTNRYLRRLAPAALILLAGAAACVPLRRSAGPPPARLVFTNESLDQADVFVVIPGVHARRIGTVMAGRTDTLVVPADLVTRGGSLNIVARLFARSGAVQSGPVSIYPGEQYRVRLPLSGRLLSFLPDPS